MNKLEEELHQIGYGLKLSKLTDAQHNAATERRVASIEAKDARIKELEAALERIASASDYYGKEASDHDEFALAYAHQSTNRLARAALKGESK